MTGRFYIFFPDIPVLMENQAWFLENLKAILIPVLQSDRTNVVFILEFRHRFGSLISVWHKHKNYIQNKCRPGLRYRFAAGRFAQIPHFQKP